MVPNLSLLTDKIINSHLHESFARKMTRIVSHMANRLVCWHLLFLPQWKACLTDGCSRFVRDGGTWGANRNSPRGIFGLASTSGMVASSSNFEEVCVGTWETSLVCISPLRTAAGRGNRFERIPITAHLSGRLSCSCSGNFPPAEASLASTPGRMRFEPTHKKSNFCHKQTSTQQPIPPPY